MSFWKVRLERVLEITPIEGADNIVLATIQGWKCVVKKGEFEAGDMGVFFPIDSLLPENDPRFAFLAKRRIRTIKLRGQISQGLFMAIYPHFENERGAIMAVAEGEDISHILGVLKYEPPAPQAGNVRSTFPYFIRKTDQERIQNMPEALRWRDPFELTEKLDGTSATFYLNEGEFGCCSRNMDMKHDGLNVYSTMATKYQIEEGLRKLGRNFAIQGEIIGLGIQGNKYKLADQQFFVFDMWDIDKQLPVQADERTSIAESLGLPHAPIIEPLFIFMFDDMDEIVKFADGKSVVNSAAMREGLVFKSTRDPYKTFKVVSNKWLLKHEDE